AVQRPDLALREIPDIRRQPHERIANADLLRERHDIAVALEEVVVETFQVGARHGKGVGLSAELWGALPERDLMPLLGQAKGSSEAGNPATNYGNTLAVCHAVTLAQIMPSGPPCGRDADGNDT